MTSGLGGMSGAQPKAATICGCISVTAEVVIVYNSQTCIKRSRLGQSKKWSSKTGDLSKEVQFI